MKSHSVTSKQLLSVLLKPKSPTLYQLFLSQWIKPQQLTLPRLGQLSNLWIKLLTLTLEQIRSFSRDIKATESTLDTAFESVDKTPESTLDSAFESAGKTLESDLEPAASESGLKPQSLIISKQLLIVQIKP